MAKSPEEQAARMEEIHEKRRRLQAGLEPVKHTAAPASQMVCPHCQTRGSVKTDRVKVKRGISGGKATGAVLTAGISILATGLSRKQKMTQARCGNCGAEWLF